MTTTKNKILSAIIACLIAVAFMPAVTQNVYAASKMKKPKITSATVSKNNVTIKWEKINNAKAYQVRVRTLSKKTVLSRSIKDTKKRTYTFKKLKYNKTYIISIRAVNGKRHSKWETIKRETEKSPYENYPQIRVTEVNDTELQNVYNNIQEKKAFVIIIKADNLDDVENKLESIKKGVADHDDFKIRIANLKVDHYFYCDRTGIFHNGHNYYIPIKKCDIKTYFAARKYMELTFREKNEACSEKGLDILDLYKCEPGTQYKDLSVESRLRYAMPAGGINDGRHQLTTPGLEYMCYHTANDGKRNNLSFDIDNYYKTYELLCRKAATGKCSEFMRVCEHICTCIGIRSWLCYGTAYGGYHAWLAVKLKDSSGNTVLYIVENGKPYKFENEDQFAGVKSDLVKGTKEAMKKAYPLKPASPDSEKPPMVTDLTATYKWKNNYEKCIITVSWVGSGDYRTVENYNVYYSADDGATWEYKGAYGEFGGSETHKVSFYGAPDTTYKIKVVADNVSYHSEILYSDPAYVTITIPAPGGTASE